MLNIFNTVKDRKLLPVVPIFNNANFPSVPWKSEINHIDTIDKLEQQGEYFDYKIKITKLKKEK